MVAQTACNGYAEFCSRSYANVSVIGAHNSYGVRADSIAANQNYTVKTQLDDGIRLLQVSRFHACVNKLSPDCPLFAQVQGHMNDNELHLCHTSCVSSSPRRFHLPR